MSLPGVTTRARSQRRLGVLAALVVALAGCSLVPSTAPIEQGPVVDSGESTQFIRVIAAPPSAGAEPEEIVRGFLEANASLEDDHAIARRYLTPDADAMWEADASTTVYDATSLEIGTRGKRVRVTVPVTGELLADGTLVNLDPAVERTEAFSLAQVPQPGASRPEWRITDPPEGVFISETDLRRAYRPFQAHFVSRRADLLVPDGRLLPVVGPSLPTTLTQLVLAGPAEWLAPAVRTGVPAGTTLELGAVPVANGVAQVELSQEVLQATDAQRRDLAAQLTWTLTQLPEVSAVRLMVSGEDFRVPAAPALLDRAAFNAMAPDARSLGASGTLRPPSYLLSGDDLLRVNEAGRTTIPVTVEDAETLHELAVDLDQRRAATVSDDRATLWMLPLDRSSTVREFPMEEVLDLSFDVDGALWVVDSGRLLRIAPTGTIGEVAIRTEGIPPLAGARLARDGARIAVIADGRTYVGVITGTETLAVDSLRRVDTSVTDAGALAWHDATTLDLLGHLGDGALQALRSAVGSGVVAQLGAPVDPVELAAAPSSVSLVANAEERILTNVGLQWRDLGPGRAVAYPG